MSNTRVRLWHGRPPRPFLSKPAGRDTYQARPHSGGNIFAVPHSRPRKSTNPFDGVGSYPRIEQRAGGRTVPGDIVVRLARDAAVQTYFDVTVVNALTSQAVQCIGSSAEPQQGMQNWLDGAYRRKMDKHVASVSEFGNRFVPLVVSATGAWHSGSFRELRRLSNYACRRAGSLYSLRWAARWQEAMRSSRLQQGTSFVRKVVPGGWRTGDRPAWLHKLQSLTQINYLTTFSF